MPYSNAWDPTQPTDGSLASQGDDEIRKIKLALDERLGTLIGGWPDDEPLTLLASMLDTGILAIGTEATKPSPAKTFFYYSTDTKKLFVKNGADFTVLPTGAVTEGEDTPVGLPFSSLTGKTYTKTGSIVRTAEPDTQRPAGGLVIQLAGVAHEKIIILDAMIRGKQAAAPSFNDEWHRRGLYIPAGTTTSSGIIMPGPAGMYIGIAEISTINNAGAADIRVDPFTIDVLGYNTADTYNYELKVVVLALDSSVELP